MAPNINTSSRAPTPPMVKGRTATTEDIKNKVKYSKYNPEIPKDLKIRKAENNWNIWTPKEKMFVIKNDAKMI